MSGARTLTGVVLLAVGIADVGWLTTVLVPEALAQSRASTSSGVMAQRPAVDAAETPRPRVSTMAVVPSPEPATPALAVANPERAVAGPEADAEPELEPEPELEREPEPELEPEPESEPEPEPELEPELEPAKVGLDAPVALPESLVVSFRRTGSDRLSPASKRELRRLAGLLKARPDVHATAIGHTDRRGSASANERLAKRRAEAVARFLERRGVASSRVAIESAGDTQPLVEGSDASSLAKNRRVEIEFHRSSTDQE